MKIKVCGMTQVEQINALNDLNADFVGFIFYEKSPRYVLNHLSENEIKNINRNFKNVGVFVNASAEEIFLKIKNCRLDVVQLHGDESPEFVKIISSEKPVIKAFGVKDAEDLEQKIKDYSDVADYFMFDTSSKNYGGTGKKFDWNILQNSFISKPYFLSGGIDENDIEAIHSLTKTDAGKHLFSLDINSRFEVSPGVKNIPKTEKFLQEIKNLV
ncbi:hypothetical protein A9P82_01935 [Arachidicoccus ginsenosidimutans]|nr:hypothetical protein A9P82_01935 [Arachidicoccus sp. BS20]